MENGKSSKKITKIVDDTMSTESGSNDATWSPTAESKSKATTFRIIAVLGWLLAIGCQVFAYFKLQEVPVNMTWMIGLIVVALIFAIIGNILWKKSNRLDPASEKNKTKFFIQNQLGLIISVLAFLPMVILIFTNKNLNGKQKGILGTIAIAALAAAGLTGTEFNPASVEQYTEQTKQVELLNDGVNSVYWTPSGRSYHLYQDCSYINGKRTNEIFQGTVAKARELKKITDLCDRCQGKAKKAKALDVGTELQKTGSD
ncbi:hypothetical protein FEE95_19445 [Maribacter algarum]|uniref:Uncharacterized protein n=1 Tax=Maribacter algarum (ex Zhang et al. 2020) TaxID=2578118 RepID=A0A5S3PLU7_9FLAO|nr:hypothetical protein [Maribacter algarum]TMM53244.1 hypothetical protein FEE95_19445 [Maribacter algarum]